MASPPIACSLSTVDYRERLEEIAEIGRASLTEVEEHPHETVLHFRPSVSTADRLQSIVSQEAACCAFLDMSLRAGGSDLVLTVRAPEAARPIVTDLIRTFRGDEH
jgi:hypothetical protein